MYVRVALLRRVDATIDSFSDDVYDIVDTTVSLSSGEYHYYIVCVLYVILALETVQSTLSGIGNGADMLRNSSNNLNTSLQSIGASVDNLTASCMGMCGSINGDLYRNGLANSYQQVQYTDYLFN